MYFKDKPRKFIEVLKDNKHATLSELLAVFEKKVKNISKCTKNKNGYRQVIHGEYFEAQREADKQFQKNKKRFKLRQEIVEHTFGTVKYYLGFPKLLLRTKKKVM